MKTLLTEPFALLHDMTTKRVIKQFCDKFEFVYFGRVDHHEDEHKLVRGITASAEHIDNHYAVGNFRGHDMTVVERQNTLRYPGKGPEMYHWLIMQIDLRRHDLPHMFLDAHHHEEVFYANLFIKFGNFENANRLFHDSLFTKRFKTYAAPDLFEEAAETLTPEIMAMLTHHFKQFDYEIDDDRLFIYASNMVITLNTLQEMIRVGLWLADQLNSQKINGPIKIE